MKPMDGSSPRVWGICIDPLCCCNCYRLTPTRVGNMTWRSPSWYDQRPLIKKSLNPHLKGVRRHALDNTLERLDKAYKNFFRRVKSGTQKPGFPRFANADRYRSFTVGPPAYRLEGNVLHISLLGDFKLKLHRPIVGDIKTVTARYENTNRWFVTFNCDNVPTRPLPATGQEVGIDVGLLYFLADSAGGGL